ncbi:AMP binding enzyme [Ceratobasidium sp. AG-Ba]|nr:AMP binding enzyme [Ceratobasidium sp. AG-Ba]
MIVTSEFVRPPTDGSLPFGSVVDFHLTHNPQHPWAVLSRMSNKPETTVTYEQLGHAVHRAACVLNPDGSLPRGTRVGILISTDSVVYITLVLGAIRAGLVPFPLSPRTPLPGITHLLSSSNTFYAMIGGSSSLFELRERIVDSLAREYGRALAVIEPPSFCDLYPRLCSHLHTSKVSLPGTFLHLGSVMDNSEALILHSSGSTGLPRAIVYRQQDIFRNLVNQPTIWEAGSPGERVALMTLPTFHAYGYIVQCVGPLFAGYVLVLFPPSSPSALPTPRLTLDALVRSQCSFMFTVPAFLEAWSKDGDAVNELRKLRKIKFAGGSLTQSIGDGLVDQGNTSSSIYGLTEGGAVTRSESPRFRPEDWNYLEFSPNVDVEFILHDCEEGIFEVVLVESETFTLPVSNHEIRGQRAYRTNDLAVQHPTKPGLWKLIGRADDQIVFLNGEKVNPEPIEMEIKKSPVVRFAAVFGRERNQAGVLIELTEEAQVRSYSATERDGVLAEIWPYIVQANKSSPAHARLVKQMVVFTRPDIELPRTPKGTIPRSAAFKAYQSDINAAYGDLQRAAAQSDAPGLENWTDRASVEEWLSNQIAEIIGRKVDPMEDLFQQGMDSLTATLLCTTLRSALISSCDPKPQQLLDIISAQTIFTQPSASQLAEYVVCHLTGDQVTSAPDTREAQINAITSIILRHTPLRSAAPLQITRPIVERVVVTGTTGALGSHLLAQLLKDDRVERVWALNREPRDGGSILDRQYASFVDKGIDIGLLNSRKLKFAGCDLTDMALGLEEALLEDIRNNATSIVHNAWPVNFNLGLQSFGSSILGTQNLIDIAFGCTNRPRFIFISSVSAAGMSQPGLVVPEEYIQLEHGVTGFGYGESKFVAEKMLESARIAGLETWVVRLGQLTGHKQSGSWAPTDWVPLIMASSLAVGCLPDAIGAVSWIPLDVAAGAIVDACACRESHLPPVIHCAHPRPTSWSVVMSMFGHALQPLSNRPLPLIPFSQWNSRVAEAASAASSADQSLKQFPSTKIQHIIDGMVLADETLRIGRVVGGYTDIEAGGIACLDMTKALSISDNLGRAEPIEIGDVQKWIRYWKDKGLFS